MGFSYLTGIELETLRAWRNGENKLSTKSSLISQKIYDGREESLSAKLATANKNPVGILAILNRHYAWNLPGVSREKTDSRQDRQQIEQRYSAQIEDKTGSGSLPEVPE